MSDADLSAAHPSEPQTPDPALADERSSDGERRPGHPNLTRIGGMPLWYFLAISAALTVAGFTKTLPADMITGFAVTMTMGGLLIWLGNCVPVLRDFGLPIVLCAFVPAILHYAGVLPDGMVEPVVTFVEDQGFLDFVVIAIIAGAILGMPRKLLIAAGLRYAVPVVGTAVTVFLLIGLLGLVLGYGFIKAILFIAAPVMAGGVPIGALPMSEMYAEQAGGQPSDFVGGLLSAVIIANVVCILAAAFLNGLGKRGAKPFIGFNGEGRLLRVEGDRDDLVPPKKVTAASFLALGQGLLIAGTLLVIGTMLGELVPALHPYAWTTLIAAAVKIFGLLPRELEDATSHWGDLVAENFVPALLTAISLAVLDIGQVLDALGDPRFLTLTIATVLVSGLVSGILGWLVKFYFIEATLAPGLVMADTGGSGDVAVLSAAERMYLMPFATIANRLGGALVLLLTSLLVPFLSGGMP